MCNIKMILEYGGTAYHGWQIQQEQPTISRIWFSSSPPLLTIFFQANDFLKHMVRNLVGTLIEVGLGKRAAKESPASLPDGIAAWPVVLPPTGTLSGQGPVRRGYEPGDRDGDLAPVCLSIPDLIPARHHCAVELDRAEGE